MKFLNEHTYIMHGLKPIDKNDRKNRPVLKLLKKKQRSDRIVAGDEKWIIKKG